ncbi:MAG: SCO family protein [Hyphomicrobiales bacterium]|nr:SCO family protein [Hyphomicrobiales bacterium]
MRKFGMVILGVALLLALGTGIAVLRPAWLGLAGIRAQPVELGAPFVLTDDHGNSFSSAALKGEPFAIFFGFTHCPDECPTTMSDLTEAMKILGPDADKLHVVFVTFDPARDTPPVLAAWMQNFDKRFIALTGSPAALAALATSYHVFFKAEAPDKSGNYDFQHTAATYLMDGHGKFVTTLSPEDKPSAMAKKLQALIAMPK